MTDTIQEPDAFTQEAPWPTDLVDLVDRCSYRPGWLVNVDQRDRGQGSKGLTLTITTQGYDTYDPDRGPTYRVNHYFPVPPAAFDRRSWQWWLFNCFLLVEQHECMEFFVVDGQRPYAPMHGPGNDPYLITVERTDVDRRTSFRGEIQEEGS